MCLDYCIAVSFGFIFIDVNVCCKVSRCKDGMYRTNRYRSTDVYIYPHVVTQSNIDTSPYTYVSRCITIHRYNAIHRYTCITTPQFAPCVRTGLCSVRVSSRACT